MQASTLQYAWFGFALGFLPVRKVADMSRLSLSDDPFACVIAEAARRRSAFSLLFVLLLPVVGIAGMFFGPKASVPVASLSRAADYDGVPDRRAIIANQIRQIELAHRKVLYWRCRTARPGADTTADEAKLMIWKRSEQHRRAWLAHLLRN